MSYVSRFIWPVQESEITEDIPLRMSQYWHSKCKGSKIPMRSDLDPILEIPTLIGNIILAEAIDEGKNFLYRVMGEIVTERYHRNMTGKTVKDLDACAAEDVLAVYHQAIESLAPTFYYGNYDWPDGGFVTFEGVACPLAGNSEPIEKIISAVAYHRHSQWLPKRLRRQ